MEIFDREKLLAEIRFDYGLLRAMARLFLDTVEGELARVDSALRSRVPAEFHSRIHHLKGSVDAFNAEPSRKIAAQMERFGLDGDLDSAARLYPSLALEVRQLAVALEPDTLGDSNAERVRLTVPGE